MHHCVAPDMIASLVTVHCVTYPAFVLDICHAHIYYGVCHLHCCIPVKYWHLCARSAQLSGRRAGLNAKYVNKNHEKCSNVCSSARGKRIYTSRCRSSEIIICFPSIASPLYYPLAINPTMLTVTNVGSVAEFTSHSYTLTSHIVMSRLLQLCPFCCPLSYFNFVFVLSPVRMPQIHPRHSPDARHVCTGGSSLNTRHMIHFCSMHTHLERVWEQVIWS